jgi:sterol desaturase/sphingolipid hydroxylase (fatty acid hydroxylase superfamily)
MKEIFEGALLFAGLFFLAATLRYLVMTGAYYFIVCVLADKHLRKFKIIPSFSSRREMQQEIFWGVTNNINFALMGVAVFFLYRAGLLKVYFDVNEYGWFYAVAIVPALLVLHDAYFFWSHYLMHTPWLRKLTRHDVHHRFRNISPWAAFSVHPGEGFVEVLIRPLVLMTIPLHPYSIAAFAFITFMLNIIGHSGYEFFPRNYPTSPLTRFGSCASFHFLHHKNGNYNYGLFLSYWDRLMGTLHPEYEKLFESKAKNNPLSLPRSGLINPKPRREEEGV